MSLNFQPMNIMWHIPDLVSNVTPKVPSKLDSPFPISHQQEDIDFCATSA
jgi:hypothetical protein